MNKYLTLLFLYNTIIKLYKLKVILCHAFPPTSADLMSAIQQYCDMLLRSGRLQELATIKQYLEMNLQGASPTKSGQVKYQDPGNQK